MIIWEQKIMLNIWKNWVKY